MLFRRQQCVDADAAWAGVSTDINSSPTYDKYDSAWTVMMMVAIADRALIVTLNAEHLGYRTQIFSAFCSGK
ncbi:hypothetical protein A7K92_12870 [Klebsiella pneumoniae]|nr:hypothetical protein A7K92_12870 [Klebsiella pneumoniae]PAT30606.1 hypothetical protein CJ430_00215 [Klebsiella pneumoniae]PAT73856.1 hypothetical protein CJ738_01245 [Klebsiella pneumoniae]PAU42012.1 hypothetical protein CKF46_20455 [Klebsiella pneumoniae]PAW18840.1 hypothetical protein CKJ90_09985 [Klebsiella pneumoniae]